MQKKYLLPPLMEENVITNDDCWETQEMPYDYLLKNMLLYYEQKVSVFEGGSNAIPHPYEQMLLFHEAFLDEHHPEHRRAVLEWRAVLMIMALQKVKNLRLSLVKVDLKEDSSNSFIRAAKRLCPEDMPIFYQTTWDFLYVLCLKEVPIAIFSPITVVCPAKQFVKKIKENMNPEWLVLEKINEQEQILLKTRKNDYIFGNLVDWLKLLNGKLTYSRPSDGTCTAKADRVKEELELFISEYQKYGADWKNDSFYIRNDIYATMSNSLRKDYDFLNNCCDFVVKNKKLQFLSERYEEDIFAECLMVVVYDEKPDAMEKEENITKLDRIFHESVEINGKLIIAVKEYGGHRIPAYVLLPFKEDFVNELIQNDIIPEEFFEEFSVIYNPTREQMEVTLQIMGFPYVFEKAYAADNWEYMYGKNLPETYIWPKAQIDSLDWKLYYTYTGRLKKDINVSVPQAEGKVSFETPNSSVFVSNAFELSRTIAFPAYICYTHNGISGYLPVKSKHIGQRKVGGVMDVFIDIGHTTTSVALIKRQGERENQSVQRVEFAVPTSLQIAGVKTKNNSARYNFMGTEENRIFSSKQYFKNMLHRFDKYESEPSFDIEMGPMGKGQTLYDNRCYGENIKEVIVSFLNFEYILMHERDRENVHMYIEQILLNAVYQASLWDATYLSVHFLHSYDENNSNLGELNALWKHATNQVKEWTGIYKDYDTPIAGLQTYKALAYNTLRLLKNEKMERSDTAQKKHLYVGVDIGWKDTCMVVLSNKNEQCQQNLQVHYAQIEYAGRDISLMRDDESQLRYSFKRYAEMLSILLNGSNVLDKNPKTKDVLEEFSRMYLDDVDNPKNREYYQGIYDVIAMMIEEENFHKSPDVFNNMKEFRNFIGMMTYNILLLFLEIGILLGKMEGDKDKVTIYLGGNGAKFLRWISNEKDYYVIEEENCHDLWMLRLQHSVLDIIRMGMKITSANSVNIPNEIRIVLQENTKEQLLEGYIYKEVPSLFGQDSSVPVFQYVRLTTSLESGEQNDLKNALEAVYQSVFHDLNESEASEGVVVNTDILNNDDSVNIIDAERRKVSREIIEKINKM